jgi:hypothetical protein
MFKLLFKISEKWRKWHNKLNKEKLVHFAAGTLNS